MIAHTLMTVPARAFHAVLKRWGASATKQKIWNAEYQSGKWTAIDPQETEAVPRDLIYPVLEKWGAKGDILDLGCGTGSTAVQIADVYRSYLGIDISPVAIERAEKNLDPIVAKRDKTEFAVAPIESFTTQRRFHIVLYRECLYYFSLGQIKTILNRHALFLRPDGVFVVRLYDRNRYEKIVDHIFETYEVKETVAPADNPTIILIFKPRNLPSRSEVAK
ncbi:MAG: class I SAM-dependent methyltransferase [Bacillota bacterium]|nr:class I SAM-dependent methyltransferase [Bacillota bacterium]